MNGLPPDSALVRAQQNAPMGWDNTTEMVATVVDSLTHLTRQFINVNSETPNHEPLMLVPRPYVVAAESVPAPALSLVDFNELLAEGDVT